MSYTEMEDDIDLVPMEDDLVPMEDDLVSMEDDLVDNKNNIFNIITIIFCCK